MRPINSTVVFRPDLNVFAYEYDQQMGEKLFIGLRAAPMFPCAEMSGQYEFATRASFRKRANTNRAPDGAYNRISGEFGQGNFACEDHGLEYRVDERRRKQYGSIFNAEVAGTRILRQQTMMALEGRVASLYSNAGFTNHNVATAWSEVATAAPLDDIITGCEALSTKTGIPRSMMSVIMPRADYQEMIKTKQVNDKLQYTYNGVIPAEIAPGVVAAMLEIKEVIIANASYDSAAEGETESSALFWAAGVIYIAVLAPQNASWDFPSAARTILWTNDSPELPVIESYYEDRTRSTIIRMRDDTDEKITMEADLLVYQLTNT